MKILASLIILGICVNVCLSSAAPSAVAQSVSSSALNNTATKVYSVANATDAAIWNPNTAAASASQVNYNYVYFGPGTTNTTSYVWGVVPDSTASNNKLAKVVRRTLNATIVGWGNDTALACVAKTDDTITVTTPATGGTAFTTAVGPGYLAILSTGVDTGNKQVYINLVTGTTAAQTKLTTTADVTFAAGVYCTSTAFGVGNVWYDQSVGAFFYTYWKSVATDTVVATATACGGTPNTVYTVNLGGIYLNGTLYWTKDLSGTIQTPANQPYYLMGRYDNWTNSSYIYIAYKDIGTAKTTYVSKTARATTTSAVGSFGTLVADVAASGTVAGKTFVPIGVWASSYTYGIAVSNKTETAAAAGTYTYTIGNYLNGTTTYTDSGLSYSSAATDAAMLSGMPLTTGYSLIGAWGNTGTNAGALTYVMANFYANGTANTTMAQQTLGTLFGSVSLYIDVNGTEWVGWQDIDNGNSGYTYAGWLAKLVGQINSASSGSALATLFAFAAFCLAALFAF